MKTTIKHSIIKELNSGEWIFGGKLARIIADKHQVKESNVERRCRELENEERIESHLVENPHGGNRVVQYRIKIVSPPPVLPQYQREVIQQTLV